MQGRNLFVRLLSPKGLVFEGECLRVIFKAGEGEITLQRNQGEFLSSLKTGLVVVRLRDGETRSFMLRTTGVAHLKENILTLMADDFEPRKT